MRTQETHLTRALKVRTLTETLAIVAAFALTAGSAIIAKRYGQAGPALVAVDGGPARTTAAPPPDASGQASQLAPDAAERSVVAGSIGREPAGPILAAPAIAAAPRAAERVITPPAGYERYFNGRPLRRAGTMWMIVTAYSPDHRSCGDSADGITSSLKSVWTNGMRLVAADPRVLAKGSLLSVPGYASGEVVPVLDTGGAIKGARLDVLYPSHDQARKWGRKKLKVVVWEYAD